MASVWQDVALAPADPILGVTVAFNADTDPDKLNLGVGAYRTEEGKPLILNVVKKVEAELLQDPKVDHEYIPIEGLPLFREHTAALLFGNDSPLLAEKRIATVQSLSGTGALRIAGEWIKQTMPDATVYLSNPTWGNHNSIFTRAGMKVSAYRYFCNETKGVNFAGMNEDIGAAADRSVIVLHTCAHNPTGADLTPEQWSELLVTIQRKQHMVIFDTAYQGYATGDLVRDAISVRTFAAANIEFMATQSYAKNLGLYGERIGALNVVCASAQVATHVLSQLKPIIRAMYSSPPAHGALIAARVLSNPALFDEWVTELKGMSGRIVTMRQALYQALLDNKCPGNWEHIVKQIGMFTFTGLTPAQVAHLTEKHHIYLTRDGRISMAGLNAARVPKLAAGILDAVTTVQA